MGLELTFLNKMQPYPSKDMNFYYFVWEKQIYEKCIHLDMD
jgi:hypothetical protein